MPDFQTIGFVTMSLIAVISMRLAAQRHHITKATIAITQYPPLVVVKVTMVVIISLGMLVVCSYVILSGRYGETEISFAKGLIGTIIGFWLRNDHAL